uniref:cytochrome c biogenesis C n=1 Tax=Andreaea regularis TaxID=2994948 RepID=UPI00226C8FB2|nr:cytochrome c biogenesis C [Andreaea regularis]UZN44041.1 cytochrome c biogenesis C [Andreaea regularis]
MYFEILRPYFLMLCSFRYAQILIGFCRFLTAMAIYLSIWVAPSDFQQGENYRIIYVHVPAARMSLLIYIAMAISSLLFLLTKHPLFQLFSKSGAKIGALFTLFTLVTGGFWGKPMWGTFWVWDARLTSVLILFLIYLGALRFQQFSADVASISIRIGLINIPIIKFSVNRWNTLHQPSSISQFGTSIHISMLIPILLILTSLLCLTGIFFILETRQIILSFSSFSVKNQINLQSNNRKQLFFHTNNRSSRSI